MRSRRFVTDGSGFVTDGSGFVTGVSSGTAAAKAAKAAAEATAEANDGGRLMPYILRKVLDETLVAWSPLITTDYR